MEDAHTAESNPAQSTETTTGQPEAAQPDSTATSQSKPTKPTKPKYGVWSNTAYIVAIAWKLDKSVLAFCVAMAMATAGRTTLEMLIAPTILAKIETHAALTNLLTTIAGFTLAIMLLAAAKGWLDIVNEFGRISVRSEMLRRCGMKASHTSFPNTLDAKFLARQDKSFDSCNSNWSGTEAIWQSWTDILTNALGFIVYLFFLRGLNPWMLALVLATSVVSFLVSKWASDWDYRHQSESDALQKRLDYLTDACGDRKLAKDVRIFGLAPWLRGLITDVVRQIHRYCLRWQSMLATSSLADVLLMLLRNGVAYVYLIHLVLAEGLPASQFLLWFSAVTGFTTWMTGLLDKVTELRRYSLDIGSLREYVEWPEPFRLTGGEAVPTDPQGRYEIRFEHVSFRYPQADHDTLTDIDLTIHPGENLAIVGLNGAGKTTLVRLACGFLDPTEGRVTLNGTDIRRFNRQDYYDLFAAVFQDFSVIESTVAHNVAQVYEGYDVARVNDCLVQAGLTEKVASLPNGIETHMGREVYEDGILLSGGQTQRLMLARALYKDAPILLLDEPTAALDPIAEDDIYRRYAAMTEGRTSLFISHRLASTRFCDRILFMEHGRIAEQGTHASLLAAGGGYAQLFEVQSKYYRDNPNDADTGDEEKEA